AVALMTFHFAVPFLLLLSRTVKRAPGIIWKVAIGILVMRLVDLFWLIAPTFHPDRLTVSWMDVVVPLTLAALWLGCCISQLRGRPARSSACRPSHGCRSIHDRIFRTCARAKTSF